MPIRFHLSLIQWINSAKGRASFPVELCNSMAEGSPNGHSSFDKLQEKLATAAGATGTVWARPDMMPLIEQVADSGIVRDWLIRQDDQIFILP